MLDYGAGWKMTSTQYFVALDSFSLVLVDNQHGLVTRNFSPLSFKNTKCLFVCLLIVYILFYDTHNVRIGELKVTLSVDYCQFGSKMRQIDLLIKLYKK
jgi:hypothetical protein